MNDPSDTPGDSLSAEDHAFLAFLDILEPDRLEGVVKIMLRLALVDGLEIGSLDGLPAKGEGE